MAPRDTYFRDLQDGFFYWRNGAGHIEKIYAFDLFENPKRSKPPVFVDKLVPSVTLDQKSVMFILLKNKLVLTVRDLNEKSGNFQAPLVQDGYYVRPSIEPLPEVKERKKPRR